MPFSVAGKSQNSRIDCQLHVLDEIAKFVVNFRNFKQTSETICQKFCETHFNVCV